MAFFFDNVFCVFNFILYLYKMSFNNITFNNSPQTTASVHIYVVAHLLNNFLANIYYLIALVWTLIKPKGAMLSPNGEIIGSNGEIIDPNGEIIGSNDEIIGTNDEIIGSNGEIIGSDGEIISPNNALISNKIVTSIIKYIYKPVRLSV